MRSGDNPAERPSFVSVARLPLRPAHLTDIARTLARIRSELMGHLQPLSQTRWTPVAGRANLSPLALPDGDAQRIGIPGGKRRITALRAASGRGQK